MTRSGIAASVAGLGLAIALAAGCKSKPSVEQLEKLKTEACACADKACADKVTKTMEEVLGGATTDDLDEKSMSIAMDVAVCLGKASAGLSNAGAEDGKAAPAGGAEAATGEAATGAAAK
jgi:hypothetical protein